MTSSTPPQHPPPIQTSANASALPAATTSPTSASSSTITPGYTAKPITTTPFTPFPPTPDYDDVESPSLTSGNALARFEFERLDSKDARDVGTKVLMVEWEDDSVTAPVTGEWTIGWEGKSVAAVVPVKEKQLDTSAAGRRGSNDQQQQLHRLYFLLPHWQRVPGTVILTLTGGSETVVWRTHPLPAIYPSALGNTARASGKRGVLHTIWAKKRLQSLASEIEQEEFNNPEGVSLDLAIQERDWIEANFGVQTKPKGLGLTAINTTPQKDLSSGVLGSPTSPVSPGRAPLLEKLKGLKLATGMGDMKTKQAETKEEQEHNPLSPETADVAVSWTSFASMNGLGGGRDTLAAKAPQQTQQPQGMRSFAPPESVLEQQRQASGIGSLNAFTAPATSSSQVQFRGPSVEATPTTGAANDEEDLFALPMSPRSPDRSSGGTKKFTFGEEDTARYVPSSQAEP